MKKITEKELSTIQKIVKEFNQTKIQLGDILIAQNNLLKKVEELKLSYTESEKSLIDVYGEDAVINIETGEISGLKEE